MFRCSHLSLRLIAYKLVSIVSTVTGWYWQNFVLTHKALTSNFITGLNLVKLTNDHCLRVGDINCPIYFISTSTCFLSNLVCLFSFLFSQHSLLPQLTPATARLSQQPPPPSASSQVEPGMNRGHIFYNEIMQDIASINVDFWFDWFYWGLLKVNLFDHSLYWVG